MSPWASADLVPTPQGFLLKYIHKLFFFERCINPSPQDGLMLIRLQDKLIYILYSCPLFTLWWSSHFLCFCDCLWSVGDWATCTFWSRIQRLWADHQAVSICQAETGLQVMQTAGSLRTALSQMWNWWSWVHCWWREGAGCHRTKAVTQR